MSLFYRSSLPKLTAQLTITITSSITPYIQPLLPPTLPNHCLIFISSALLFHFEVAVLSLSLNDSPDPFISCHQLITCFRMRTLVRSSSCRTHTPVKRRPSQPGNTKPDQYLLRLKQHSPHHTIRFHLNPSQCRVQYNRPYKLNLNRIRSSTFGDYQFKSQQITSSFQPISFQSYQTQFKSTLYKLLHFKANHLINISSD